MSLPVSIILNLRDGASFLAEAVESALAQSFCDWEMIAWDDGSQDESAAIIARYRDSRIRYFLSPEATGLGRARDLAIRQASGEWLAFLDQDDIWLPRKLERQIAIAAEHPRGDLGLVYGRTIAFHRRGYERDFDVAHEFVPLPEGDIFLELFRHACFIAMSSAMFRHSAVEELGGIPKAYSVSPDYFLFTEIARKYGARAVQEVVCRYRVHGFSLSQVSSARAHEEGILIAKRWAPVIDPRLASRCYRFHATQIARGEMSHLRSFGRGVWRLVRHGSIGRVLSRPPVRTWRVLRRKFAPPVWVRDYREQTRNAPKALSPGSPEPAPGKAGLLLSVIAVNWKVRDLLRECLRSLIRHTALDPASWQIIVVDNASDDGTPEMMRTEFPGVELLVNSDNVGFGKANNQALRSCRGKYILLLNPDTVVLPGAIDRMLAKMEANPGWGAVGCKLLNDDGSIQRFTGGSAPTIRNVASFYLFAHRLLPGFILPRPLFLEDDPRVDTAVGWVSGACVLLRRSAFGDYIFDERFFLYGEDLELCQRLAASGWKVVYTPDAEIIHFGGRSLDLQSPALRSRNLVGMREVYLHRAGFSSAILFDLVMSTAFLIRSVVFGIATRLDRKRKFEARAVSSRFLFGEAVRLLFRLPSPYDKR